MASKKNTTEADRIAAAYRKRPDLGLYSAFRPQHLLMLQEVERSLIGLLTLEDQVDLQSRFVLEVGCGNGYWLRRMLDWGCDPTRVAGIDILPEKVSAARSRLPAACDIRQGDATSLPWDANTFDIVTQNVMFSSVLDGDLRKAIAHEMMRVARPGGCVLWYDFTVDNPRNPDVKGVPLEEMRLLFPSCRIRSCRVTIAPPLARQIAAFSPWLCRRLEAFPFLKTHLAAVVVVP